MTEIPPHPVGLSRQDMFKRGFFAGVEYTPGIANYPPVEIETRQHSTSSDDATITTLVNQRCTKPWKQGTQPKRNQRSKKINSQHRIIHANIATKQDSHISTRTSRRRIVLRTQTRRASGHRGLPRNSKKSTLKSNTKNDGVWDLVEDITHCGRMW